MRAARLAFLTSLCLLSGIASAEQITSTCRITAVDAEGQTVTLVRKSTSGGKIGACKVADDATIELNGIPTQWDAVTLPCEATVVYDVEQRAAVAVHVWETAPKTILRSDQAPTTYNATASDAFFVLSSTLTGHARDKKVLGVAFSPDGRTLASCSEDGSLRLWDLTNPKEPKAGRILSDPQKFGQSFGSTLAYTPDGKTLVMGMSDGKIHLWNIAANSPTVRKTLEPFSTPIYHVAFGSQGRLLAAGAAYQDSVSIWDLTKPDAPEIARLKHDDRWFRAVAFSRDSRMLAIGARGGLYLYDSQGDRFARKGTFEIVSDLGIQCVCFSPDATTLACGDGRLLRVLRTADFSPIATLDSRDSILFNAADTPDGRLLLTTGLDSSLRLWDMRTNSAVATTGRLQGILMGMAVSPDGKYAATGGHGGFVRLWKIPEFKN